MSQLEDLSCDKKKPDIKNIKGHFKLKNGVRIDQNILNLEIKFPLCVKRFHNFIVIKLDFVYTIFLQAGFINVTKIKSFINISESVKHFCNILHISRSNISLVTIDNITASGSFCQEVNLLNLHYQDDNDCTKRFDCNYFPGAFVKFNNLGTIIVFRTGSYTIIGAKSISSVTSIFLKTCAIINML